MISANDVRKGNYIISDLQIVQIITIEYDYFICKGENDQLIMCRHVDAQPVVLNNIIFNAWGFTRKDLWWSKGPFTLYDSNQVSSSSFMFRQLQRCTFVKYLHQLQNLYYSIEGIELERIELEMEEILT